jgi:hypothetical protein
MPRQGHLAESSILWMLDLRYLSTTLESGNSFDPHLLTIISAFYFRLP